MPILNVMSYNLFGICGEKGERGEKKDFILKLKKSLSNSRLTS